MGRRRSIDRDELMQAVERVARRAGIDGISINAVAKEAGISKSSVVYDCGSKAGLFVAFTRYRMAQHRASFDEALMRQQGKPNPHFRALIEAFRTAPSDEDIAMALLVGAGMGQNDECREVIRAVMTEDACQIAAQAQDRQRMLMALLTLQGMAFLEYFGFYRFDEQTRSEILDKLMTVAESDAGCAGD